MRIIYIDCQNVHLGTQACGWTIDWKKFLIYIKDTFAIDQTKIFLGWRKEYTRFYTYLQQLGYTLVFKQTSSYVAGNRLHGSQKVFIKGNIDAELILEAVRDVYEKRCSQGYLFSGDGDFAVLVAFWKEKDAFGGLFVPEARTASWLLRKVAGKQLINTSLLKRKIEQQKKPDDAIHER